VVQNLSFTFSGAVVVQIDFNNSALAPVGNWNVVADAVTTTGLLDFDTGVVTEIGITFSGSVNGGSSDTTSWQDRTVSPSWAEASTLDDRFFISENGSGTMTLTGLVPGTAYNIELASGYGGSGSAGDDDGVYELTDAGGLVEGFNVHTETSLGTSVSWTPRGPSQGGVEGWLAWYDAVAMPDGTLTWSLSVPAGANPRVALNAMRISSVPASPAPTGISSWRQTHFGSTENTGDGADTSDPEGDGLENFLEYAFGGSPTIVDAQSVVPELLSAGSHLEFRFNRARSELTYRVEVSNDLNSWTTLEMNPGNVGEAVTVTDTVEIGSQPSRFMRLEVLAP
jgi:hypothetical protein